MMIELEKKKKQHHTIVVLVTVVLIHILVLVLVAAATTTTGGMKGDTLLLLPLPHVMDETAAAAANTPPSMNNSLMNGAVRNLRKKSKESGKDNDDKDDGNNNSNINSPMFASETYMDDWNSSENKNNKNNKANAKDGNKGGKDNKKKDNVDNENEVLQDADESQIEQEQDTEKGNVGSSWPAWATLDGIMDWFSGTTTTSTTEDETTTLGEEDENEKGNKAKDETKRDNKKGGKDKDKKKDNDSNSDGTDENEVLQDDESQIEQEHDAGRGGVDFSWPAWATLDGIMDWFSGTTTTTTTENETDTDTTTTTTLGEEDEDEKGKKAKDENNRDNKKGGKDKEKKKDKDNNNTTDEVLQDVSIPEDSSGNEDYATDPWPCTYIESLFAPTPVQCTIRVLPSLLINRQISIQLTFLKPQCSAMTEDIPICSFPVYSGIIDVDDTFLSGALTFKSVRVGNKIFGDFSFSTTVCVNNRHRGLTSDDKTTSFMSQQMNVFAEEGPLEEPNPQKEGSSLFSPISWLPKEDHKEEEKDEEEPLMFGSDWSVAKEANDGLGDCRGGQPGQILYIPVDEVAGNNEDVPRDWTTGIISNLATPAVASTLKPTERPTQSPTTPTLANQETTISPTKPFEQPPSSTFDVSTLQPSRHPAPRTTAPPTFKPTIKPTFRPTFPPKFEPTMSPSSSAPTSLLFEEQETPSPTVAPTTAVPAVAPPSAATLTAAPTTAPTAAVPTAAPTAVPTIAPIATIPPAVLDITGHDARILQVSYSPDGERLATAGSDNTVKIWDVQSGSEKLSFSGHIDSVEDVDYSPDGTRIATAAGDGVGRIWDAISGGSNPLFTMVNHTGPVFSVKYSPDGSHIVSVSGDRTIKVWDSKTSKNESVLTISEHQGGVNEASFSPDGSRIVSASDDGTAKVFDANLGTLLLTLNASTQDHPNVWSAAYSPDGAFIATGLGQNDVKSGIIKIWNAVTGLLFKTLQGHKGGVTSVKFDPTSNFLASGAKDNSTKLWKFKESVAAIASITGHSDDVNAVEFSPDGMYLASCSEDKTAKIWNISSIYETGSDAKGFPIRICDCMVQIAGVHCRSCGSCPSGGFVFDCSNIIPRFKFDTDNCVNMATITSLQDFTNIKAGLPDFLLKIVDPAGV